MRYFTYLFLPILLLFSCKKAPEKLQPTLGKISESVYASGIIKSKNQYQVYATVSGLIKQVLVAEGDLVKKGDPLFIIENETSRLNTENARLSADFAAWNTQGERLKELQGAIETARSKMLNDSLLLDRQRGLWAEKIGSKVELEQRELTYTSSVTSYQAAVSRYNDLKKQLGFAAAQTQKLLSINQKMAQDYIIRSQTDGRVYSIAKEVGEMATPQSAMAVIGAADGFEAELQIDESDIVRVKPGLRVLLTLDSYKGEVFEAVVAKIDPIMNERTQTFRVLADFSKQPPTLYPNLTVEANIVIRTKDNVVTIPRAFILHDSLVMMADKTTRRVEMGLKDYQKAEIVSGLSAGETILKPVQ